MKKVFGILVTVLLLAGLSACDKINNASRTMDTMLGGDYEVHIQGFDKPFYIKGGKVTSVPDKGYYVFYPMIEGKEKLVQSPIQLTTIIKTD
ncbi:hypothetical protein A3752_18515 [Oleiphilus sp. HI0081]|jgi:hypothetical protein|nr:hypothetical protein A3741_01435 [Oleiphilus sp. HI0069]KZY86191.1 hypothetical protein A3743_17395 [Oleiphilus sp. HI0072]KZZ11565.1 hypothetical protein A3749_01040 [Oleiphilus sp. HI0078]KZZ29682.1 hypothetical protein A3752_18515 [Oleiphilus sp. HI0081]KZZ47848.1 hypothetical protein A3755_00230 [Oleiphilus sp. HI0085]